MGNISRVLEHLQKDQKEMLEIKNTVTEMKNDFDEFISKLDMTKERLSELENTPIKSLKTETQTGTKQTKTKTKNRTVHPRNVGNDKCVTYM